MSRHPSPARFWGRPAALDGAVSKQVICGVVLDTMDGTVQSLVLFEQTSSGRRRARAS